MSQSATTSAFVFRANSRASSVPRPLTPMTLAAGARPPRPIEDPRRGGSFAQLNREMPMLRSGSRPLLVVHASLLVLLSSSARAEGPAVAKREAEYGAAIEKNVKIAARD